MQGLFDVGHARRKQQETQNAELAEFSEKIKKMFQDSDPKGTGTISRAALTKVFRELDASWSAEDLDEMISLVGGGSSEVRYADFVDWFMEEEDPKLRKQLWQSLSNAFATSEAEEQDDPADSDNAQDELEAEEELEALGIDLDELITYDLWQGLLVHLDIDEDEGQELYDEVAEEMLEKGQEDAGEGFPLREYLEELKIDLHDREGILAFKKALDTAKKDLKAARKPRAAAQAADADAATVRTLFDKVVRALDFNERPAEDGWRLASEGSVQLSKAEQGVCQNWPGGEDDFIQKVKEFMVSPPLVNAAAGQTVCKQQCIAEVEAIIKKYEESGTKFVDPDWNVKSSPNSVLYVDKEAPGYDCTVGIPARWKRLTDIEKNAGGTTSALGSLFGGFSGGAKKKPRPVLFKGGVKAGDIIQGNIGTCFLLGAMGALASRNEEAIRRMFIKYDVDAGVYGVRFNIDGAWSYVIIDDFMPVDYDGNLLYAHSQDSEEVWVPLLEKAFCKLHTCYEMCDGGEAAEAINTMMGGVGGRFLVKKQHRRNPGLYFKILKQAQDRGWLLTTGFAPRGGSAVAKSGKCGEAVLPTGLVGGHAYSIVKIVDAHGHKLICCRNPWGSGEWTGKWSDENADGEWTQEMKAATGYRGLDDGRFWMCIEDFVANTVGVDYARTFGPNWKKVSQYKRFLKTATLATAQYDYSAKEGNELSFRSGDKIEVTAFTSAWWSGNVIGESKEGFFPGNYVEMDDRPVACFELCGTPHEGSELPVTAVVMLQQPKVHLHRKWTTRSEDGMHYKDLTYSSLLLVVLGPDGSVAVRKEGQKRCVWGELKLPGGGTWRIYALSTDGRGDMFTVRAYVKDGRATLTEAPEATLLELMSKI